MPDIAQIRPTGKGVIKQEINTYRLAIATFFAGEHDHAVGGAGTPDTGGRSIFEDGDGFDGFRVQRIDIALVRKIIENDERAARAMQGT